MLFYWFLNKCASLVTDLKQLCYNNYFFLLNTYIKTSLASQKKKLLLSFTWFYVDKNILCSNKTTSRNLFSRFWIINYKIVFG